MPAVQYPFIDIAVHDRVRERFARGEAIVLFSREMDSALWANGLGADLFGNPSIYDFLEQGPNRQDVSFRQLEATARQLSAVGDRLTFLIRVASGFQRVAVQASAELIRTNDGQVSVLFSAPIKAKAPGPTECARQMLAGFDDPDTHMAVLDGEGQVISASNSYAALGITPQTARMLVTMAGNDGARLIKRPIPTGKGYLPAAIGKLSDSPALHLLFAVETVIGMLDPTGGFESRDPSEAVLEPVVAEPVVTEHARENPDNAPSSEAIAAVEVRPDGVAADAGGIATDDDTASASHLEEVSSEPATEATAADVDVPEPALLESAAGDYGYADAIDGLADIEDIDSDPEDMVEDIEDTGEAVASPELVELTEAQADLNDLAYLDDASHLDRESHLDGASDLDQSGEVATASETDEPELALQEPAADESTAGPMAPDADEDELPFPLDQEEEALPEEIAGAMPDEIVEETDSVADVATVTEAEDTAVTETSAETLPEQHTDAAVALPIEPAMQAAAPAGFVYNPSGRPLRFVWKIDAAGRFSEVSGEFAQAVGPRAADITGIAFVDLAALFNLDPDGKITELLNKRDTWSGKTIHWPIEGTALMVPVDLAALPTYTRNREFDGFRGFGIVRMADATEDPHAVGLTLSGDGPDKEAIAVQADTHASEPVDVALDAAIDHGADAVTEVADGTGDAVFDTHAVGDDLSDSADADAEAHLLDDHSGSADIDGATTAPVDTVADEDSAGEGSAAGTPAREEVPALRIVETPNRRYSDKVIQLEDRRARGKDGLTPGEQAAFREIARQLDPEGKREAGPADKDTVAPTSEAVTGEPENITAETRDGEPMAAEVSGVMVPDEKGLDEIEASDTGVDDIADDDALPQAHAVDAAAPDEASIDDRAEAEEDAADAFGTVLHSLIPPRAKMVDGLSPGVIDLMPVALLVHGGDELIHGNPEFLRLTGYGSLAELQDVGGLDALLQRQELEENTEQPGSMMLVRADDALIPVTARLQSIRWEDTSALMLALMPVAGGPAPDARVETIEPSDTVALQRDSERSERLQAEVEELRSILETATDGVVLIGTEGDIRSMNRSASALFNYDNAETQSKPFVMLFAHESQKAIMDYLAGLAGHGVASVLNDGREVIGREASGGFLPLFMTIGRLTSSDGYCAVIRDITQWKRTEEELRGAKRAAETANAHKSDFLARVSHEIRTPLNAIIGFADMMATERFGPMGHARYVEYADDISRSGRHVLDIVNDLLDISKIEAGEMDLDFVAVGLNESISEAVSIVQQQANSQRVIIRTSLSQAVPQVVADLRSVKQIVLNILSNAIRFTPSGGQIVVSTAYEASGNVVLRIRDTGVGMTRTELEQAMKPFRQVMTGSRKRGDGTGLGLPLTKAMVDANRATFSIHSAPNEGTLVEVIFPSQRVLAN